MSDDDWLKMAATDDALVARLLLRLNRPKRRRASSPPPLQLHWSVRQRRSRGVTRLQDYVKKKGESTRASPTTPLSFSGATSVSGGAVDGFEESSKPVKPTGGARSKATTGKGEASTSKRPRKKKTLAELREEESLLLKERKKLKSELAALRLSVEKQRSTNESLKRLELDYLSQQTGEAIVDRPEQVGSVPGPSRVSKTGVQVQPSNLPGKVEEVEGGEAGFFLPDLNFPPEGVSY
ncbi:hypothetical protein UlMin_017784 [Ulmus minor]